MLRFLSQTAAIPWLAKLYALRESFGRILENGNKVQCQVWGVKMFVFPFVWRPFCTLLYHQEKFKNTFRQLRIYYKIDTVV